MYAIFGNFKLHRSSKILKEVGFARILLLTNLTSELDSFGNTIRNRNKNIKLLYVCCGNIRISFRQYFEQAKLALKNYKEAEELFMLIQNEKLLNDYVYISHLARCCK